VGGKAEFTVSATHTWKGNAIVSREFSYTIQCINQGVKCNGWYEKGWVAEVDKIIMDCTPESSMSETSEEIMDRMLNSFAVFLDVLVSSGEE